MARRNQEAIDTFISITGASEAVAVQMLEEHGGDLNAAVNAHFSEGDQNIAHEQQVAVSRDDAMNIDDLIPTTRRESPLSLLSEARTMSPFPLLGPNFGRSLFNRDPFMPRAPFVTHPRQVREIPIEVKDSSESSGPAGSTPIIQDVTETAHAHGPDIHGTVTIDDEDDDDIPSAPTTQNRHVRPNASVPETFQDFDNDVEEEMIRAAIEASKKDAEKTRDPSSAQRHFHLEDDDMAQTVTMSLKSAEEEGAMREQLGKIQASESGGSKPSDAGLQKRQALNGRLGAQSAFIQDDDPDEDAEEQPFVRHRSRQLASGNVEPCRDNQSLSHGPENVNSHPPNSRDFAYEAWGGISSEERDEAVMLEAAMFGGIPGSGYHFPYMHRQRSALRPPLPSLEAQRLIREQQDDEYLASLQADREKEMKAMREAEARHLEDEAAKRAVLEEEKKKEEEARRKMEEEQELERQLATKEASLPQEPSPHEENAVTLLVRMPDGSRQGRRFLKSDQLQSLFDFIDIGRVVKPGTYRLVRPYPRRLFSDGERVMTLAELGLTNKQEALFLELI